MKYRCFASYKICSTVLPTLARGRPPWRSTAFSGSVLAGPYSCSEVGGGNVIWWTDLGEGQHIAAVYLRLEQTDPDGSKADRSLRNIVHFSGSVGVRVVVSVVIMLNRVLIQEQLMMPAFVFCSMIIKCI